MCKQVLPSNLRLRRAAPCPRVHCQWCFLGSVINSLSRAQCAPTALDAQSTCITHLAARQLLAVHPCNPEQCNDPCSLLCWCMDDVHVGAWSQEMYNLSTALIGSCLASVHAPIPHLFQAPGLGIALSVRLLGSLHPSVRRFQAVTCTLLPSAAKTSG